LISENNIFSYRSINKIHNFLKRHPRLKLITGVNSYATYPMGSDHSETARMYPDKSGWYDGFNAAFEMDHSDSVHIYHKFKLVPGVEKMPYPAALSFLESYSISMGGPGGSLGSKYAPYPFVVNDSIKVAPIICYESIFGSYVGRFVTNGASVLAIITNDGWWQNTPGYKQHLYVGALRAIETREFIVRAANTGISCFIMPSGDILQATDFWVKASIKSPIILTHKQTFYTRYGDYIGWIGVYFACLFIILWIVSLAKSAFLKPKRG
jgi:apolipoprotein N-acyltransferase